MRKIIKHKGREEYAHEFVVFARELDPFCG